MAWVPLLCPFCNKRLETPEENVGREGQCPGCEKVFPIERPEKKADRSAAAGGQDPSRLQGWLSAARDFEYQDTGGLLGVSSVALGLVLLVVAGAMPWVKPARLTEVFLSGQKIAILIVSIVCCLYFVTSFLGGKSLVPAALIGAGWGTVVAVWASGLIQSMHQVAKAAAGTQVERKVVDNAALGSGVYVAVVAGLLTLAAGIFFYYKCRDSYSFQRIGWYLAAVEVIAVTAGLLVLFLYVKPTAPAPPIGRHLRI
ncbi:MAG: hypothetical protein ACYTFZ_11410 [Planctomycetota bacterium]|jgi:hypothetical protein